MQELFLSTFLLLFGIACGFFIGAGNRKGIAGAIIPGIITGLLISGRSLHSHEWVIAVLMFGGAMFGSFLCAMVSDRNRLKDWLRNQSSLHIKFRSYELGRESEETDE
jgi:hypothetical protein